MATRASARGGDWVLTGRKLWITNGNEAGLFIVFANVSPDAGYRGITAFLIERGFDGFTVGKKEDKLGIRASSTCELLLEECRVPRGNVLGEIGKGYKVAIETLNEGRIGIGAQMIGLAQGALDHAIKYTKERKQFGNPLADFQAVQHQIARPATEVEAAGRVTLGGERGQSTGGWLVACRRITCRDCSGPSAGACTGSAELERLAETGRAVSPVQAATTGRIRARARSASPSRVSPRSPS